MHDIFLTWNTLPFFLKPFQLFFVYLSCWIRCCVSDSNEGNKSNCWSASNCWPWQSVISLCDIRDICTLFAVSSFLRSTALVCFLHPSQAVRLYCYWSPWFGYCLYHRCFFCKKASCFSTLVAIYLIAQFLPLHVLITRLQRVLFDTFF